MPPDPVNPRRVSSQAQFLLKFCYLFLVFGLLPAARAALPPGWTDADLGSPGQAGSATETNGGWTMSGGGSDIWNQADQFNFASVPWAADGAIVARVTSVQNVDPWSKAGVMLRNDSSAGSMNVAMVVSAANGVSFQWRNATDGDSSLANVPGSAPLWVALTRSGENFNGYMSADGTNWTQVGSTQTVPLNGSVLAGLAVTAHNAAGLATATFTNVALSGSTWGVYRELWTNLNPNAGGLAALTNAADNPGWPNAPVSSFTHVFTNFETEINSGMSYYGQRVRALIVPPETGSYTFWIASDDNSQLWLSTDETPSHRMAIASVTSWTSAEEWYEYPSQQSAPVTLTAGSRYFVEADMQQGNGGDNLAVGWQLPDGTLELPMTAQSAAGTRLIPYTGADTLPGIYLQSANVSVVEGQPADFFVLATNQASLSYRWYVNGTGTSSNQAGFLLTNASLTANNGQTYTCVVSNALGAVTSAPIVLTVQPDTTPPTVARAFNIGKTEAQVVFSKAVTAASAQSLENYVFTDGLAVSGATLGSDNVTVTLTTAPMTYGSNYTLVINGILDRATTPVMIASNTMTTFTASPYVSTDIGAEAVPSAVAPLSNGVAVTAGGGTIGGEADACNLQWQTVTGNFDVAVRLGSLSLSSLWANAGLMARATLDPGSAFAAALATPGMAGSFFESRSSANATAATAGSFPVNFPNTWLRLKRAGNVFTGYASYDGAGWSQLGSATLTAPSTLYLGLTTASAGTNATAADFIGYTNTAITTVAVESNPHEPPGASSRKTQIVFSEIMYKPAPRTDGNNCEFIELYNSQPWFHDISHYQIVCADMQYQFPAGTILPGGGYVVVAASPQSVEAVYGITNVLGPYTGSLKKAETLELLDEQSNVLLTVPYTATFPWPTAADGTGHSIVLANPSYGEGDPRAWDISDVVGGSPGAMEAYRPSPLRSVVINEILAHAEAPGEAEFVELYNHSVQSVDVSGCVLTDDPATNRFVAPAGSLIPAGGFLSFDESQLGFALNPAGETLYLIEPDRQRVLDSVQFTGQPDGTSWGRWPDGANDFYFLQTRTPGTNNSAIAIGPVAINELMYDPISGNDDDQYLELYNQSTNALSLAGWQLTDGISYTFPASALIPANGYVVVGRNIANLFTKYTNLNTGNTFGNYSGKLSHNGERVALTMPAPWNGTNVVNVVEDEVTYGVGGRWGQWSSGGGSSLELIDPHSNHRLAANWADSDETQKSQWVDIENTGVLDNGANYENGFLHAQIGVQDVGECLVDNLEVDSNGVNYVANPTFESGLGNWELQGDHSRSSREAGGYQGGYALHLRATDRFWTGINSCQMDLKANSLAAGDTVTLRFKARWLHGWPEVIMRLNGNWLDAAGALPLPSNLGTPGAPNSRLVVNAGPAIYQVSHSPAVPAANQAVVVTARVHDPDGVQALTLHYRVDPSRTYVAVTMHDDGTGGDAMAGDGIYSATIPGRAANVVVAFYLTAQDTKQASTLFPAALSNNAPMRECVVMFGDSTPGGVFSTYHMWITQTNTTRWQNLADLSNELNDFTFVNNNRIIYNVGGRFAGSPYHQDFDTPMGASCHYKWEFPDDDEFLGATDFNKIHNPGNYAGDDGSLQREQIANSLERALGIPWLNRRYVAVYCNGVRRGTLMEDAQTPGADVVKEHFPNDTDGFLFKMQPWFEFAPTPSGGSLGFNEVRWCDLYPYTTTGGAWKISPYRYNFEIRRTPDSCNDYADVYDLIGAAETPTAPNYVANMKNFANMENWMRFFAANHAAGNWDCFGSTTGQNLYGYVGTKGVKYTLMMWDFNIVFGNSGSWGPGQNLFSFNGEDQNIQAIFSAPEFLRMYWRALQELANGALAPANAGPLILAKYQAFVNSGLTVENPASAILPWMGQAASSIASQLAAVNAGAFSVNARVVMSNNVAYVSGVAPVNVATIEINGADWPVTWTSLTGWTAAVPVPAGLTTLAVMGLDRNGNVIAGDTGTAQANLGTAPPPPQGRVMINEIMHNPAVSNAQYVEFYNNATNTAFDLSGWEVPELSYVFPAGSEIGPGKYLVLAQNGPAYDTAYGVSNTYFDTFAGALPLTGETTLNLVKPGPTNVVVTEVKYSDQAPWPTNTDGTGAALQLIDPRQDNWRAGNWTTIVSNAPAVPQWVHVSVTGTASSSILYIYLQSAGDVYVDDIYMVAGSVPETGQNHVADGGFESGFPGSAWHVSPNLTASASSPTVFHSGSASLHVISSAAGTTESSAIWQTLSPALTSGAACTLSFWYRQSTNGGPLTIRLSGSGTVATVNPAPAEPPGPATPGFANSVAATLPTFPTLWINEVEAENLTGPTNRAGQHSPWIELYNPGSNAVALGGLFLATNEVELTNWAFPAGTSLGAGAFAVVFADGQTNLTTAGEIHAGVTLPPVSGSIALSRVYNGTAEVLDFVDYTNLPANYSYGSYPDGQSFVRQFFPHPTPGAPNNGSITPPASFIPYLTAGAIYSQNFDGLPNPGAASAGSDNPVSVAGITYSLSNPFDFAGAVQSSGNDGGLGLSSLAGWYGLGAVSAKFGATSGDDTTGGDLSFGLPNSSNRALGLLATSSTGATAFGAKFINGTGQTLHYISVQATAELWRQSNLPKNLVCYYFIDDSATNLFSTDATGYLPNLNVSFPTASGATGGVAVDGAAAVNQLPLSAVNQPIGDWKPGAALWLTWEMPSSAGKSQGMGIDNLAFSAGAGATLIPTGVDVATSGGNLILSWTGPSSQAYQIQATTNLAGGAWTPVTPPTNGTGALMAFTNSLGSNSQRFYRLVILPLSN